MGGKKLDKTLLSNTFFLYLLTFSSRLFSLATVPYLTRILGAVTYGKTGIALAYMSYVAIIMDLGFILSGTQKVVNHKNDILYISKLICSVALIKFLLGILVSAIFTAYILCNPNMRYDFWFYFFYLAAFIVNAFLPDFYYRGIEKMKVITYRTLAVKTIFTVLIFILVKDDRDYWLIPLITLLGNALALIIMYYDLKKNYGIRFCRASLSEVWQITKDTLPFFASRIASTVYQALNTIILSFVYGNSPIIGYYTSVDKIVSLSKTVSSPLADSLYPYMLREKDFKTVKRLLIKTMPVIIIGTLIIFIYAKLLCIFLFGREYASAGNILRCLLPIIVVILPTYLLCFPVMVPLGLSKYANMSNIVGMGIQIIGLVILIFTDNINVYSICIMSSVTEVCVFLFRLAAVLVYRQRIRHKRYFRYTENSIS
ncbi:PST family polysaccharide transporter [Herbinix hemicellulosilytica]|uniref:Putative membrane protein n=1 Tax=Herbinix hemicellulosilytica TaxID=1564487 RepID=A0A0H5SHT2_HERHM|nr:oligosaccharide flippase family protein [Herbinix hemicellulosilytica]RBP60940.1 PST family polysaccharide transporter [Herbinix hemicellulosilytica]CRZ34635.1 putative membrane protein [Herbinix hemicellulosilytica]